VFQKQNRIFVAVMTNKC